MSKQYKVFVDGVDKGEVFKQAGRWYWRRAPASVDPFPRRLTKAEAFIEIAEWARRCCNGKTAEIMELK